MVQAQKQHQQQHTPAQQHQQQAVAPGVQLANMPAAHLGPITNTQTSINWYSTSQVDGTNISSPSHHVHMMHEQYPTPPSHHSSHVGAEGTPQHVTTGYPPEHHYLTPSPDSPGQWSSSSPHSAQSDWSEGISSPTQPVGNLPSSKSSVKRDNASVYL